MPFVMIDSDTLNELTGGGQTTLHSHAGGGGGPTLVRKTANQTINGNAYQDITDLSFSISANTTYYFDFIIIFQSAATTTGFGFSINGPTSPTVIDYVVDYQTTANATGGTDVFSQRHDTAYDAMAATASTVSASVNLRARVYGIIRPSAAGTLAARVRSELANNNLSVRAESIGILHTI